MNFDLSIIQHETEFLRTANKVLREECEQLFADYTKVVGYFVPLPQCRQNDDWETLYIQLDKFARRLNETGTGGNGYRSQGPGNPSGGYGSSTNGYGNATINNDYRNYNSGSMGNPGNGSTGTNFGTPNGGFNGNGFQPNSGNGNSYGNSNASMSQNAERRRVDLEFATQRVAEFITRYNNFITQGTQYYRKFDNIITSYAHEEQCSTQLPRQFSELKYDIKSTIEKFTNTYDLPEIQGSRLKNLLYGTFTH